MLCAIFNTLIYNKYSNLTCQFSCWINGMHDLRLLCCYLFVNLNEIQDIISHNLYIFNKCRIFVCGICLICLTVVLFFWIVIVALFALIDFVLRQISNIIMERKLMWAGGKYLNVKICANTKWKSINKIH